MTTARIAPARLKLKRAYAPPARGDGLRILVDRLWPRGLKKDSAALDDWIKEVAPSPGLRQWFGHDPERWSEFRRRYTAELRAQTDALERIRALARKRPVTLIYAARDEAHNHALVLRDALLGG